MAKVQVQCSNCQGKGEIDYIHYVRKVLTIDKAQCPDCQGKGYIEVETQTQTETKTETTQG